MVTRREFIQRAILLLGAAVAVPSIESFALSLSDAEAERIYVLSDNEFTGTLSDQLALLKEFYSESLNELLYEDNPFLALTKGSK